LKRNYSFNNNKATNFYFKSPDNISKSTDNLKIKQSLSQEKTSTSLITQENETTSNITTEVIHNYSSDDNKDFIKLKNFHE